MRHIRASNEWNGESLQVLCGIGCHRLLLDPRRHSYRLANTTINIVCRRQRNMCQGPNRPKAYCTHTHTHTPGRASAYTLNGFVVNVLISHPISVILMLCVPATHFQCTALRAVYVRRVGIVHVIIIYVTFGIASMCAHKRSESRGETFARHIVFVQIFHRACEEATAQCTKCRMNTIRLQSRNSIYRTI